MGDDFQDSDEYQRRHGTAAPGSAYQPPQVGGGRHGEQAAHLPSQVCANTAVMYGLSHIVPLQFGEDGGPAP